MASQQPARPFFRLGSFRPVQTAPQRAPPPTPAPQPLIVRPAVPRFRTPASQTTPPQVTAQIAPPATPAPPPTTVIRATVVQPRPPLTNPSLSSSPPPVPTATIIAPSAPLPAVVAVPLVRPPPTQPNLATSKPVSPQPRFMASSITSSPITKTEAVMRSSPQQTTAAAPQTVPSPRFLTDKSANRASTPSPVAMQPKTIPSVGSASPIKESSALQNSFIKKSYPESSKSETVLGSRSPPPSEPLPTAVPASKFDDRGDTTAASPRNGTMLQKTPPQSPLARPLTHPPSPLTLPPAQIKTEIYYEPNTVPKHQTTVKNQERNGNPKVTPDPEQSGMRVIRLAGQNHGAMMELSPSRTKGNHNGWTNGRKTGTEYGKGNEEESSHIMNDKTMAIQAPPVTAFMNSNVQGMNNSIVYNSSFNHNDPGVHFSFSKKPNGGY